jgi:hypothetical protein
MNAFRFGLIALTSLVSLVLAENARADVRPLAPVQLLDRPAGFTRWAQDVAVDGGHIIVLAAQDGAQQALLYRRSNATGKWEFRRAIETWTGPLVPSSVSMRNGIAAIQFGTRISIFEITGGDYVRDTSVGAIQHHGGVAISGNSVLIGGDNCDYDAVIYQKNSAGSWAITGRLDDNQGQCLAASDNYALELYYDYALLRAPGEREAKAFRRNGTALDWIPAGTLPFQTDETVTERTGFALQGATAVAPNGVVWRRTGTSTWTREGVLTSVDQGNSQDITFNVAYRDGVLVANEAGKYMAFPRAYAETSPGHFEHVATMRFFDAMGSEIADVSGRTIVVTSRNYENSQQLVRIYDLPQRFVPGPVVNDFEDRNVSDFTFASGQFALATRGSDDVLAQGGTAGLAVALVNGTDWNDDQRVEADITPTFGANSWVGLVARYIDANNYYYLAVRDNNTYGIYKRVNGVDTQLYTSNFYNQQSSIFRAVMQFIGDKIHVHFNFQQGVDITDRSLTHGRAGLATNFMRADFDDVQVSATDYYPYELFSREWEGIGGSDRKSDLDEVGGHWQVREVGDEEVQAGSGLEQTDSSGSATAIGGTPVANVDIDTFMRVESFAPSQTGAWFGLLARYIDARNHYYVTWRATGQVQIRKIVNGVITVLGSSNIAPVLGQRYHLRFSLVNDQLQLYVNDALVATAHDRDIASGRYGLATYRAAAVWSEYTVAQP